MNNKIVEILQKGGVGIMCTDTLYGLVGSALNKKTVSRIYKIKGRSSRKPFIILIASIDDLKLFGIKVSAGTAKQFSKYWPGPVSIILPCSQKRFAYLHRGAKTLAFRLPKKKMLVDLIRRTGPLVAPSANPEGQKSAHTIKEARHYFDDTVDFYFSGGKPKEKPSMLVQISGNAVKVLRK